MSSASRCCIDRLCKIFAVRNCQPSRETQGQPLRGCRDLTRIGSKILSAAGPSTLILEGDKLDYNPNGEVNYVGRRHS